MYFLFLFFNCLMFFELFWPHFPALCIQQCCKNTEELSFWSFIWRKFFSASRLVLTTNSASNSSGAGILRVLEWSAPKHLNCARRSLLICSVSLETSRVLQSLVCSMFVPSFVQFIVSYDPLRSWIWSVSCVKWASGAGGGVGGVLK